MKIFEDKREEETVRVEEVKKPTNFQYPKKEREVFEVVLVGINFLILKNKDGNNVRVKCPNPSVFSVKEKIQKEYGKFVWETK